MEHVLLEHKKRAEDKGFLGVEGLVEAASEVIGEMNKNPIEGKEVEVPSVRMVRYYLAEGVLNRATEKSGHSSLFRYDHLISLLIVKWFQAWRIPISAIQEAIRAMNVNQLEKALGERVLVFTNSNEFESFVASNEEIDEDGVVITSLSARREYLKQFRDPDTKEDSTTLSAKNSEGKPVGLWKRITIVDGLEIQIESSFRPPRTTEEKSALIRAFERLLDRAMR